MYSMKWNTHFLYWKHTRTMVTCKTNTNDICWIKTTNKLAPVTYKAMRTIYIYLFFCRWFHIRWPCLSSTMTGSFGRTVGRSVSLNSGIKTKRISVWVDRSMIVIVYGWVKFTHRWLERDDIFFYVYLLFFSHLFTNTVTLCPYIEVIITFRTWMNKNARTHYQFFYACFHLFSRTVVLCCIQ